MGKGSCSSITKWVSKRDTGISLLWVMDSWFLSLLIDGW